MGRWLLALRTPVAVGVLLLIVALTLVGSTSEPLTHLAGAEPADAAPMTGQIARLRDLPVFQPDGFVERTFPDGRGLEHPALVRRQAQVLATRAGIGPVMPALWHAVDHYSGSSGSKHHPFRYPTIERVLDPALTPSVITAHRSDLVELAGLLMVAAAANSLPDGPSNVLAGLPAYVLLNRLAADPDDCDAHLDLAELVALGQHPQAGTVDALFAAAVRACPGDPTALWRWGQAQQAPAAGLQDPLVVGLQRSTALARPLATYRRWEHDQPGSALPWAGEAGALVDDALQMTEQRSMPLTARADAELALERYRTADRLEPDPAFVVGEARALDLVGRHDEAVDAIRRAVAAAPAVEDYRMLEVQLLEADGRYDDAAAAERETEPTPVDGLRLIIAADTDTAVYAELGGPGATWATIADVTSQAGGASNVDFLGNVPVYRQEELVLPTDLSPWCRTLTLAREAVLAARYDDVSGLTGVDDDSCQAGRPDRGRPPGESDGYVAHTLLPLLEAVAADRSGDTAERDRLVAKSQGDFTLSTLFETEQNLFRYAGDLDRAEAVAEQWRTRLPKDALASLRLGEIQLLRDEPAAATTTWNTLTGTPYAADAELDRGTALRQQDPAAAAATYEETLRLEATKAEQHNNPDHDELVRDAASQLGNLELAGGDLDGALGHLTMAAKLVRAGEMLDGPSVAVDPLTGSLTNGAEAEDLTVAILAKADTGKHVDVRRAVRSAAYAVLHDPLSAIYLDALAQAQQLAGHPQRAVRTYRRALASDATLFQSWNNLGVILAQQGRREAAIAAFRSAVAADPSYARAWFNLGVELGRHGDPRDLVAAERASATAVRLDRGYRTDGPSLLPDTSALESGLDVSRPVPPAWTFVHDARPVAPSLTWLVLVVALLRLVLALGLDKIGGEVGGRLLDPDWHQRRPWTRVWHRVDRYPALLWGLVGGLAIAAVPLVRGASGQWAGTVLVIAGLASALWLYVAAPRLAGGGEAEHHGWGPGIGFAVAAVVAGYTFVPVPVNRDADAPRRVRWAGAVTLASLSGLFLLLGLLSGVPLARTLGIGILAMLSTALFPLRPFDGGYARSRPVEAVTSLAALGLGIAIVLGAV